MCPASDDSENREYPIAPIPAAHGVLLQKDQVLLIKRAHEPSKGRWSLPGGKIELGETLSEAVAREFKEETGITVRFCRILNIFDNIVCDENGAIRFHYIIIYCLVDHPTGTPKAASDATAVSWFNLDDIYSVDMHEALPRVIQQACKETL